MAPEPALSLFTEHTRAWFSGAFAAPTAAQEGAWRAIAARRHALIAQAARIKERIGLPARIDDRVEEVVANAGRHAASRGLDPALIQNIWRQLVEAAIAQEDRFLNGDRP